MASYYVFPRQDGTFSLDGRHCGGEMPCTLQLAAASGPFVAVVHKWKDTLAQLNAYMQEACTLFPWLPEWGRTYEIEFWDGNYNPLSPEAVIDMRGKNVSELMLYIVYARLFWEHPYQNYLKHREAGKSLAEALILTQNWHGGHSILRGGHQAGNLFLEKLLLLEPSLWIQPEQKVVDAGIIKGNIRVNDAYMGNFFTRQRYEHFVCPDYVDIKTEFSNMWMSGNGTNWVRGTSLDKQLNQLKEYLNNGIKYKAKA